MSSFWRFAKHLLHERITLFWAIVFAFFSAGGLAAGLLSMGPMLAIILEPDQGKSLRDLATEFNAQDRWTDIPGPIIDRLPADPFASVVFLLACMAALTIVGGV